MNELTSAWMKYYRAQEHLTRLRDILRFWIGSNDPPFRRKVNSDGNDEYYHRTGYTLDIQTYAIYGDFVHNLRSVLDHVAMALAVKNDVSPDDRTIAFPVGSNEAEFNKQKWKIKKISPCGRAFIEELQPYNRHGDLWPLADLEFLDNRDKHRNLNLQRLRAVTTFRQPQGTRIDTFENSREGEIETRISYPSGYGGSKVEPQTSLWAEVETTLPDKWIPFESFERFFLPCVRNEILIPAQERFFS
jgi:hypothetical protein